MKKNKTFLFLGNIWKRGSKTNSQGAKVLGWLMVFLLICENWCEMWCVESWTWNEMTSNFSWIENKTRKRIQINHQWVISFHICRVVLRVKQKFIFWSYLFLKFSKYNRLFNVTEKNMFNDAIKRTFFCSKFNLCCIVFSVLLLFVSRFWPSSLVVFNALIFYNTKNT